MKHILSTAAVLLLAGTTALHAQFNNPALDKHSDDVTFYVNFDEGPNAALSTGTGAPFRSQGKVDYIKGLSGKALRVGQLFYRGDKNLDLSASGTLIYWVAPEKEFKTKPANGKEPGFIATCFSGGKYTYSLFSGKMGGQPWQKAPLNSYVQYAHRLKIKHVNCLTETISFCKISEWNPGDWRMFAVTWAPGKISASYNGGAMTISTLKVPMTGTTDEIRLGFGKDPDPAQMLLDEVIILKKAITEQEIKEIYDLSVKQLKK